MIKKISFNYQDSHIFVLYLYWQSLAFINDFGIYVLIFTTNEYLEKNSMLIV